MMLDVPEPVSSARWLRSIEEPLGKSSLTQEQQALTMKANAVTSNTFEILAECSKCNIPWTVENPNGSIMWHTPAWADMAGQFKPNKKVFDYCQFGMKCKKRTQIWSWSSDGTNMLKNMRKSVVEVMNILV